MPAPRFVVSAVLVVCLLGCTSESRSSTAPQSSSVLNRLSDLERENRKLRSAIGRLGSGGDQTRGISQRVQTLEHRIAGLQQRLSIVERR